MTRSTPPRLRSGSGQAPLVGPSMLALVGDPQTGPALWRVLQPYTALQKRGYLAGWDRHDAVGIGDVAPLFDGYVLPRTYWRPGHRHLAELWFSMMRRAGRFVVYDVDDDVFSEELDRRTVALGWSEGKSLEQLAVDRAERIWTLRQCDGVTVSTQRLATVVRSLTDRPVVVVPNAIDIPWFRRALGSARRQTAGVTIGWAGGRRPDDDLVTVAAAWARIAARYPGVRFVVQGHVPRVLEESVPSERLVTVPWMALERYPIGLVEVDIACCSVVDTPFNRSKSAIKAYEAAVAGAAVVATPTVYGRTIEHGRTGYLAESVDDWTDALAELVESRAHRRMIATRLLRYVERRCALAVNLHRWPAAWSAIRDDMRARRVTVVA